jgi:hypothetical protein
MMHSRIPYARSAVVLTFVFVTVLFRATGFAEETNQTAPTNSFPTPAEIFQGRGFANDFERDIFFLRAVHSRYPSYWPDLLEANINLNEYVRSPLKMMKFVEELGVAMQGRNDLPASTNLALVTSDSSFFTNANAYHPEILQAAAKALIQIGPEARKALASSFTETHYREDSVSLEDIAKTIGKEKPADSELAKALAATAFNFSTANGGSYPRCTTEMVKNLLCLPEGAASVRAHLNTNEVFDSPGRFQSVLDGIAAARTAELATNLAMLATNIQTKLDTLTNNPGPYRDDLQDLDARVQKTLGALGASH